MIIDLWEASNGGQVDSLPSFAFGGGQKTISAYLKALGSYRRRVWPENVYVDLARCYIGIQEREQQGKRREKIHANQASEQIRPDETIV